MCGTLKEKFHQTENINFIKNKYGKEMWVQVAGKSDLDNGSNALFWCALLPLDSVEYALKDCGWETFVDESNRPGFIGDGDKYQYKRFSRTDGIEPLVYSRYFSATNNYYYEISEEFRHLFNLYYDLKENKCLSCNKSGIKEEVIRIKEDEVYIRRDYLVRYATAKQMVIALYFDIQVRIEIQEEITELTYLKKEIVEENFYAEIICDCFHRDYLSSFMGKRIIYPQPIETCGFWPYEERKEKEYLEFVIGINEDGAEKKFTCNPEKLDNYFSKNPGNLSYLTPVFFNREVLGKYINNPEKYQLDGCSIRCGNLWLLQIDNDKKEYLSAYLGDLGRDLPTEEQLYWKSFNILIEGTLGDAKIRRDFLAEFARSEKADIVFKEKFNIVNNTWFDENGWYLFLPLLEQDKHNFNRIILPIHDNQKEFDELVLSIVKVLIDSINQVEIKKLLRSTTDDNGKEIIGSINYLEQWFLEQNRDDYKKHIEFLKNLQNLRSKGCAHRKGSTDYEKIAKKFNIGNKTFLDVFDTILLSSIDFLDFIESIIKPIK